VDVPGKDKPKKEPVQPRPPFGLARVNDLSTAGTLNEALDAYEVHHRTDGIGFMILGSGVAANRGLRSEAARLDWLAGDVARCLAKPPRGR
jgi:hypothetical protein